MQSFVAAAALAAFAGVASAQTAGTLVPTGAAPSGCQVTYPGTFEITVVKPSGASKRSVEKRATACNANGTLVASLTNGVLTDSSNRIGGIVANGQFQFDGPVSQAGTIYNGGFSICSNGTLALGSSTVFYQCLSGDFYNLYDISTGAQCSPVAINVLPCAGTSTATGSPAQGGAPVTQSADGQPGGPAATQIADGQIQAASAIPVSQIADGQIQIPSATPVAQIADGQIQATTAARPVAQITDGQIQATTAAAPVSQISDGQVQAASATPVAQIADGQVQAKNATTTFTGAAVKFTASSFGFAAVVAAIFL